MDREFPIRPQAHNLEELSERFFNNNLPDNWTSEKPRTDYGIDLRIDIFEGENATGLELLVQLKASQSSTEGENEQVTLKTTTYNHLWDKLQVVMLVKYVIETNEAYWILLSKVPQPDQKQKTFTVNIPKHNMLSNIDWEDIKEYVRKVTDKKLAATRRDSLMQDK